MKCIYSDEKAMRVDKIIVKLPIAEKPYIDLDLYKCVESKKLFAVLRIDRETIKYKIQTFPLRLKVEDKEYIIPYEVFDKYASKAFKQYYSFLGIITCLWNENMLFYRERIEALIYWKFITIYIDNLHFGRIPIEEVQIIQ